MYGEEEGVNELPCYNKKMVKHLKMVRRTQQKVPITSQGNYIEN